MTAKLTDKQKAGRDLLASDARQVMLYGGARSGKTFLLVRCIVARALKAPGSRHAIWRHRFNAVKRSIWLDTLPKVMQLCFPGVRCHWDNTDFILKFDNKSEIWLGGLDNKERTEKVLGQEYATIYYNECSQIPYSSVKMGLSRLAQKTILKQRAWFDCNPPGKSHWTYQLFVKKIEPTERKPVSKPDDYLSMVINPADNLDNLDPEFLRSLETLPSRERQRFLDGKFLDDQAGAIFQREWFDLWPARKRFPFFSYVVQSYDTAFTANVSNHPTACTTWGIFPINDRENGALLIDCWSDHLEYPDLRRRALAEFRKAFGPEKLQRRPDIVLVEEKATGYPLVQDLRRAGLPVRGYNPGRADKVARANSVSHLVEYGLAFIPESMAIKGQHVDWADEFLDQMTSFSADALRDVERVHDPDEEATHHFDYVDTATQFLALMRDMKMLTIDPVPEEEWEPEQERVNPYAS